MWGHDMYWVDGREEEYGIDEEVAYRMEIVFEGLETPEEAADFAVASIEAIPVGADLSGVVEAVVMILREKRHEYYHPSWHRDVLLEHLRNAPIPEPTQ